MLSLNLSYKSISNGSQTECDLPTPPAYYKSCRLLADLDSHSGLLLAVQVRSAGTPGLASTSLLGFPLPHTILFVPQAGQPIPTVQLFVVNLSGMLHVLELLPPEPFLGR